jgi:hypothetical protein
MRNPAKIDEELRHLDNHSLRDLGDFFEKWSELCRQQATAIKLP